jgi:hypothetical protein
MDNEKRIKELETELKECKERLAIYEDDYAASFYKSLVNGIKVVQSGLDNRDLDLSDSFNNAVITLADKSSKIFDGLKAGREAFSLEKKDAFVGKAKDKAGKDGGRSGF